MRLGNFGKPGGLCTLHEFVPSQHFSDSFISITGFHGYTPWVLMLNKHVSDQYLISITGFHGYTPWVLMLNKHGSD